MPGIHIFSVGLSANSMLWQSYLSCCMHNESYKAEVLSRTLYHCIALVYYPGYPFSKWENGRINIVLEGMVYNKSKGETEAQLKEIASRFVQGNEFRKDVQRFVESTDGDYIVAVWESESDKLLIFNDYFGRLPLYYYNRNGKCAVGREIKALLGFIPRIGLNKAGIVEFLTFEYPLGSKTIFSDILRLNPGQMLEIKFQDTDAVVEVSDTAEFNFDLKDPFPSRKKSIDILRDLFLQSTENRMRTLERIGYRIVADLSGGYDTRTILGGLSKVSDKVSYYSQKLATKDETTCSQAVFAKMGCPGSFLTVKADHSFKVEEVSPLVFQTDGLVDCFTTYTCYQASQSLRNDVLEIAARVMGFGGEFTRHPFVLYARSLLHGIDKGFYSNVSVSDACQAIGYSPNEYYQELEEYLRTYPEKTPEGQLRRFYYEYYNHYVNAAGEDRARIHFWTVQPLWSLSYLRAVFARVPLHWVGYKYFVEFMKAVDPRLLHVPIFGCNVLLESNLSVNFSEAWHRFKFLVKINAPILNNLYGRWTTARNIHHDDMLIGIRHYCSRLALVEFPGLEKSLAGRSPVLYLRVLTLLMYLTEVERHYVQKVEPIGLGERDVARAM